MRYVNKFIKGDDITLNDYAEPLLDVIGPIPDITELHRTKKVLDDLPIRVKTRFRSRTPGRRVVSAPTFDLVTPMHDLDYFKEPPRIPLDDIEFTKPKSHRSLPPPLPERNASLFIPKHRSLPPLPESPSISSDATLPKNTNTTYIRKTPQRLTSMPVITLSQKSNLLEPPTLERSHLANTSIDNSYISIIQSYADFNYIPPSNSNQSLSLDPIHTSHSDASIISDEPSSIYSEDSAGLESSDNTSESESESEVVNHVSAETMFKSMVDEVLDFNFELKEESAPISKPSTSPTDYSSLIFPKTRIVQRTPSLDPKNYRDYSGASYTTIVPN